MRNAPNSGVRYAGRGRRTVRGQLLVVQLGFLEAGSSLQGGASGLQGGVCDKEDRTVRPINSGEKGNFVEEEGGRAHTGGRNRLTVLTPTPAKGRTRNERNGGRNAKSRKSKKEGRNIGGVGEDTDDEKARPSFETRSVVAEDGATQDIDRVSIKAAGTMSASN